SGGGGELVSTLRSPQRRATARGRSGPVLDEWLRQRWRIAVRLTGVADRPQWRGTPQLRQPVLVAGDLDVVASGCVSAGWREPGHAGQPCARMARPIGRGSSR